MEKSFKKEFGDGLNPWGHTSGMTEFLAKFIILLKAREKRGRFGTLQRFYDQLEPGRHKSHVLSDIKRGADYLLSKGIIVGMDEFGFKVETKRGFSQYLSLRATPKKEKEAKHEKLKKRQGENGRFFWEREDGERSDEDYKSFL